MNDKSPLLCTFALILGGAHVAPAWAADSLDVQLKHCASVTVAGARLACYDDLASSSGLSPVAPPTAAASSSAAPRVITSPSGIAAPNAPPPPLETQFGVHNGALEATLVAPHREKRLLAVVSTISNRPRGELVVTLDNGQVWVQLQPTTYPLRPGDHVEIDVGALGSYVLWCPSSRRSTKVTRIS
jgi:hypothetical protein